MCDHRKTAKSEQVRTAVGVGVEALPEPARGRSNQQAAELASRGRGDLRADALEDRPDRPFDQLEGDVAREAVRDDDVAAAQEEIASLGVACER